MQKRVWWLTGYLGVLPLGRENDALTSDNTSALGEWRWKALINVLLKLLKRVSAAHYIFEAAMKI